MEQGLIVLIYDQHHTVRPDALEPDRSHEESCDHAALNVEPIVGELVDVRRIHDIWVRYQVVTD